MTTLERTEITVPIEWSAETRTASGGLRIKGRAIVYNSVSNDLGGFREIIKPGAFRRALAKPGSDLRLLRMHDRDLLLARQSAGTLRVTDTPDGIEFEADIVPTTFGQDTALLIRSGHMKECSFAFSMPADGSGEEWSEGGTLRTLTDVHSIFELTVCDNGAYSATEVSGRSMSAEEIDTKVAALRAQRKITTRDRSSYGPDSEFSFYRDVARRDENHRAIEAAKGDATLRGVPRPEYHYGGPPPQNRDGTLEDALKRLKAEERAGSTVLGNLGEFVPQSGALPGFVASAFVIAVRNSSQIPAAMRVEQLPASGMAVTTPRFGTGAAVSVDQEGMAVADVDPTTTLVTAPVGVISGEFAASRQLAERALGGAFDQMVAAELGAALGEKIDFELLNGTGTNQRVLGLLNVTPGTTVTYTTGAPTVGLLASRLALAAANGFVANGDALDSMLWHPSRGYWYGSQFDTATATVQPRTPVQNVCWCPQVPTNLGAGVNQDTIWLWKRDESPLFAQVRAFRAFDETLSGTLQIRWQIDAYLAPMWNRRTASIARVSGTGLTPAAYS